MNGISCMIGSAEQALPFVKTLARRNSRPFVLIEPQADTNSPLERLPISWSLDSTTEVLPAGNGVVHLDSCEGYLDLCTNLSQWGRDHYIILHIGSGLQLGCIVMNILNSQESAVIVCDDLYGSLRKEEDGSLSPGEFLKKRRDSACGLSLG